MSLRLKGGCVGLRCSGVVAGKSRYIGSGKAGDMCDLDVSIVLPLGVMASIAAYSSGDKQGARGQLAGRRSRAAGSWLMSKTGLRHVRCRRVGSAPEWTAAPALLAAWPCELEGKKVLAFLFVPIFGAVDQGVVGAVREIRSAAVTHLSKLCKRC